MAGNEPTRLNIGWLVMSMLCEKTAKRLLNFMHSVSNHYMEQMVTGSQSNHYCVTDKFNDNPFHQIEKCNPLLLLMKLWIILSDSIEIYQNAISNLISIIIEIQFQYWNSCQETLWETVILSTVY